MASASSFSHALAFLFFFFFAAVTSAQLSSTFYDTSCPKALSTIKSAVNAAVAKEARMGASLLRLHFHDCFVQASLVTSLYGSIPSRRPSNTFVTKAMQYHALHACIA